jgi:hypothetical protein
MKQIVIALAALVLIVFTGVIHGRWTNRWQVSDELTSAAKKVEELDRTIGKKLGQWEGEPVEISERESEVAGIVRYFAVRYQFSGEAITAFLVCGKHGPISVHLPQVCYVSAGYEMASPAEPFVLHREGARPTNFRFAKFSKRDPTGRRNLRIYWTFGAGGRWLAPDVPRFALAGHTAVYKLYVIHELSGEDRNAQERSTRERQELAEGFMRQLMDALDAVLFEAADRSSHGSSGEGAE